MAQLVINRIRLENFLSHRDTEIKLVRGVNVFVGPNGAGKTSILEAIHFALTGKGWRTDGRNRRDLVNKNASTALVELEFTLGEDRYTVRRRIGGPGALLQRNNKAVARDEDGLNKHLAEIIGVDPEKLRNLALIPQGGITRIFVEERPSDRKKILDMILGLQEYDEAGQKLVKISIMSNSRFLTSITATQAGRRKVIENIQAVINKNYNDIRREIEEEERKLRDAEKQLEEIEHEIRANKLREKAKLLEELEKEYNRLSRELSRIKGELDSIDREIRSREEEGDRIKRELRGIDDKIKRYTTQTRVLEYEEEIERLRETISRYDVVKEQLNRLSDQLKGLEDMRRRIDELRRKYPRTTGEIDSEKQVLEKRLEDIDNRLRGLREKIASADTQVRSIRRELDKYSRVIEESRKRITRVDRSLTHISEEELATRIQELKEKLSREKERLEKEINETLLQLNRVRETIADLREKKNLLEKTRSPTCPLCGSPLTEEHRRRIVSELEEEIKKNIIKQGELEKRYNTLVREREEVLAKLKILEDPVLTRLFDALEEKKRLLSNKEEIEEAIDRARVELRTLEDERDNIRRRLSELEEEHRGASRREELEKAFDEERYRRLVEEKERLEDEARRLGDTLDSISGKFAGILGIGEASPKRILELMRERVEEARKIREELIRLKTSRESLSRRLREIEEELKKLREDYRRRKEEYDKLVEEERKLREKVMEARNARDRLVELDNEITRLKTLAESGKRNLEKLLRELRELDREVEEANRALRKALIVKWLRDNLFHKDGVPKHLRKRYIAHLESLMENLMNKFNLEYHSVRVDEDYGIWLRSINYPNKEVGVRSLSGGEKVVVSLVAMLALYQLVVGGKIGFLALDEPTEYLDTDRREELVNVLKEFQGGKIIPQLLVVTHDESVREAGDIIFRVYKENGYSRVKPVETSGGLAP